MMAMENPQMIRAEAIEAMEFYELASEFNVGGVPHTQINGHNGKPVIGAVPEASLLAEIMRLVQRS
jgi:hypothetical protein